MKTALFLLLLMQFSVISVFAQDFNPNISKWISAKSGLRMRDAANLEGKKLEVIPFGEKVRWHDEKDEIVYLADTRGKWTLNEWKGDLGWVYGGFLSDLNPEKSQAEIDNYTELTELYYTKWGKSMVLGSVEVSGYGFRQKTDGTLSLGDGEYDIEKSYRFEKGVSLYLNEGYEWGGTDYEFDAKKYTIEEVFNLAITIYRSRYAKYLESIDF